MTIFRIDTINYFPNQLLIGKQFHSKATLYTVPTKTKTFNKPHTELHHSKPIRQDLKQNSQYKNKSHKEPSSQYKQHVNG